MAGYLVALDGVTAEALKHTAMSIIQGEIEDMSTKVCPLPPELSRAVRKRMREDRKRELALAPPPVEPPPPREKATGYTAALNAEFQAWHNGARAGPLMLAVWEKHFPHAGPYYSPKQEDHHDTRPTAATDEPEGDFVEPEPDRRAEAQTHTRPGTDDGDRGDGEPAREAERD